MVIKTIKLTDLESRLVERVRDMVSVEKGLKVTTHGVIKKAVRHYVKTYLGNKCFKKETKPSV